MFVNNLVKKPITFLTTFMPTFLSTFMNTSKGI